MKGQAFITNTGLIPELVNKDINDYGATLIRGWREALLQPYEQKDYVSNESRNEHGKRVVALPSLAKMKSRQIQIQVLIEGSTQANYLQQVEAFLNAIKGTITLKVMLYKNGSTPVYRSFNLVYLSSPKYGDYGLKKGVFSLKFDEPVPYTN